MLVQVRGDAGARDRTLVHPDVEAVRTGDPAQGPHRVLRQGTHLGHFVDREVAVVGDVAIRAHQQVPGVVRELVQHHVRNGAASDDE